jgi:hypothetical protein
MDREKASSMQRLYLSPSLWPLLIVMVWHVAAVSLLSLAVPLTPAVISSAYTQARQLPTAVTDKETRSFSSELCLRCKDLSKQGLILVHLAPSRVLLQRAEQAVLSRQNLVTALRLHSFPRKLPPPTSAEGDIFLG